MTSSTFSSVYGNQIATSQDAARVSFPDITSSSPRLPVASNPLERLAQLVVANNFLMDELTISRARIVSARAYLDRPGCNSRFGAAHLERCRSKHSGILAQLRANRIESLHLLDQGKLDH